MSKVTGVKNQGQILHFLTPVEFREGLAKCLSLFYQLSIGPNL